MGSEKQQAARQHLDAFRHCSEDLRAFLWRQRKVNATVVEEVVPELLKTPLAELTELVARVNAQLGRQDLTAADSQSALARVPCAYVP